MSKAFTRASENDEDEELEAGPALPVGVKNDITRTGFNAMREELDQRVKVNRPKVVETVA